jgi:hypothetical protein
MTSSLNKRKYADEEEVEDSTAMLKKWRAFGNDNDDSGDDDDSSSEKEVSSE